MRPKIVLESVFLSGFLEWKKYFLLSGFNAFIFFEEN